MKKTRTVLGGLLLLALLLAAPMALQAQETDPVEICYGPGFEAFVAREQAFTPSYWHEDAVQTSVMGDMVSIYTGHDEIRAHMEELWATKGFDMEISVVSVEGDTVTAESRIWDDDLRALGVAPLIGTEVCVVEDGKIQSTTWTLSEESLAAFGAALAALPQTGGANLPAVHWILGLGVLCLAGGISARSVRRRV
jgi:hypothetical protein